MPLFFFSIRSSANRRDKFVRPQIAAETGQEKAPESVFVLAKELFYAKSAEQLASERESRFRMSWMRAAQNITVRSAAQDRLPLGRKC